MKNFKRILFVLAATFTLGWIVRVAVQAPVTMRRVAATTEGEVGFLISYFANHLIVITVSALITYALWRSTRKPGAQTRAE